VRLNSSVITIKSYKSLIVLHRQCKLYRVLRNYALFDAKTSYTQGMSTIAAILLLHIPDERVPLSFTFYTFNDFSDNLRYNLEILAKSFASALQTCQASLCLKLFFRKPSLL
jgi:Rab-GTPase-TBC domain